MAIAMRVVSAVTIPCFLAGFALIIAPSFVGGGDVSPLIFYGFLFLALSGLLAVATVILGIVAMARRRQFALLVALIVAACLPIGTVVADNVLDFSQIDPNTGNFLSGTLFPVLAFGGAGVGVIMVFVYSFFLRSQAAIY